MTDDVPDTLERVPGRKRPPGAHLTPSFLMFADFGLTGGFRELEVAMIDGANSGLVLGRIYLTGAVK